MRHIHESIIGRRGNAGKDPKGILREFDIVTSRTSRVYMVIFDERIIEKAVPKRMKDARLGLLLGPDYNFMFLSRYTDDLILDNSYGKFNYSPYDIMEIYRNPVLDSKIFKRDMLSGEYDLENFDVNQLKRSFYKKIWERK